MNTKQLPNESIENYKLRICSNKKLLGLTWEEIAKLLNKELDLEFGESYYRKWYKTFDLGRVHAIEQNTNISEEVDELNNKELNKLSQKKLELQIERNKLSAEKTEINKWLREMARTESIYEKISDSLKNLPVMEVPVESNKMLCYNEINKKAVLDLADSHYGREGKIVGLENETIAEYNINIFEKRMWELQEKTISICKNENIDNLIILNLGDSVDGMLRMSQLQFLQLGMVDQVIRYSEFMSVWLNEFSKHLNIDYHMVLGNHSENRPLNSNRGDFQNENMERIISWYLSERLSKNDRVTINEAKPLLYIDVLGTKILATHGQDERNLENSIKEYSNIYNRPIHILKTGHLHHHNNKTVGMEGIQNIEYIQSPAICGIDEYSMKLKKVSNAGSLLTVFLEGYGKYCTYDIRLK